MDFLRDTQGSKIVVLNVEGNPITLEKGTRICVYVKKREPGKQLLIEGIVKSVIQHFGIIVVTAFKGFDYRLRFGAPKETYEGHPVPMVTEIHGGYGSIDLVISVRSIGIQPPFEDVETEE